MRVAATSVNPVDCKTRSGAVPWFLVRLPRVGTARLAEWWERSKQHAACNQFSTQSRLPCRSWARTWRAWWRRPTAPAASKRATGCLAARGSTCRPAGAVRLTRLKSLTFVFAPTIGTHPHPHPHMRCTHNRHSPSPPPTQPNPNPRYGTYAEFVSAATDTLARIPEGVSYEAAAATPLAAMTAWQALEPRMPLEGKRVLVHAGAGGVGSFAIQVGLLGCWVFGFTQTVANRHPQPTNPNQPSTPTQIAKAQGAHVTATCGPSNVDLVRRLGADTAVDYTCERFEAADPGPFDVVVDLVGGEYEARGLPLLRKAGRRGGLGGHYVNLLTHGWNKR